MPATQLIPVGTVAAVSAEITVNAGDAVAVAMKGGDGTIGVELKDDAGGFSRIHEMRRGDGFPASFAGTVLSVPGVYRLSRRVGDGNCGAFRG